MENISKLSSVSERDIAYYQRRNQNRLFEALTSFFADEAEKKGLSKKDIADAIRRDPATITRLLSAPSNVTTDTVSAFLLSLGAEMDYRIVRFEDRSPANEMHPLIARINKPTNGVAYNNPHKPKPGYESVTPAQSNTQVIKLEPA